LAVALAAAIAMSLAPRLAWAQDQSLVPVQVQSQAPAATQSAAPQPNQDNATQADGNCPGHPGALGTSRVLALDPGQYPRVGHMQYPDTLPLNDKEVVLTFDDGPVPPYSNEILDILASQCVKATYFMVGEMARAYPAMARRNSILHDFDTVLKLVRVCC
jgi:peptidoglycan/xylan/chitin deacetylase (PgdA/CDA1 family)